MKHDRIESKEDAKMWIAKGVANVMDSHFYPTYNNIYPTGTRTVKTWDDLGVESSKKMKSDVARFLKSPVVRTMQIRYGIKFEWNRAWFQFRRCESLIFKLKG